MKIKTEVRRAPWLEWDCDGATQRGFCWKVDFWLDGIERRFTHELSFPSRAAALAAADKLAADFAG